MSQGKLNYQNFIAYFQTQFQAEKQAQRTYETTKQFLLDLIAVAKIHRDAYEKDHGRGSYGINFSCFGTFNLTPVSYLEAELTRLHLFRPKSRLSCRFPWRDSMQPRGVSQLDFFLVCSRNKTAGAAGREPV